MELNSSINNKENKFDFTIEPSDNIINDELETRWKEIEDETFEKINKNKESIKLNNLNNFTIMRINLDSLIHPIDEISEFEDYCNLKIKQLDKQLNEIEKNSKYNSDLINFSTINYNKKNNNENNNIKSFLKPEKEDLDLEDQMLSNLKNYTLDEIIEFNKNKKRKKKLNFNKIFKDTLSNTPDSFSNKTFIYNPKNKFDYNEDSYEGKLNNFQIKLNQIKNTYLKKDNNYSCQENNNISNNINTNKKRNLILDYKSDFKFSGNNTTKNKTISDIKIKNKIDDSYNYLYNLFPSKKKSK